MEKFKRIFIRTFLIVLITLLIVEVLLQLGSVLFRYIYTDRIEATFDQGEIRILAVGESTTAPVFAGGRKDAWPALLKEVLVNKYNLKNINVLNMGVPGTTTTQILAKVKEVVPLYRPHFVISMMGVNDYSAITQFKNPIFQPKLFKLSTELKRFRNLEKSEKFYSCRFRGINAKELNPIEIIESTLETDNPIKPVIEKIGENNKTKLVDALITMGKIYWHGNVPYNIPPFLDLKRALEYFDYAYKLHPSCFDTVQYLAFGYLINNQGVNCQKLLISVSDSGIKLNTPLLRTLRECYDKKPLSEARNLLRTYGLDISSRRPLEITFENYRHLAEYLKEQKIQYVVLPYPRTDRNLYKEIFSGRPIPSGYDFHTFLQGSVSNRSSSLDAKYDSVIFLENQSYFEDAIKLHGIDHYFEDLFGVKFGHANYEGNKIIAETVADQIYEMVKSTQTRNLGQ